MKPDFLQRGTSGVGVALFVASIAIGFAITAAAQSPAGVIAGALVGVYLVFAIKVADQWEKVAVLRFGRYMGLRGPGIFHIVPIVDQLSRVVDQRVRVANVSAESTLTRDTVPVNVDAIVFWMVWNPEKSILEVQDFDLAITLSAQTALRESIGRHELHQMVAEREMLGHELQRILDAKTNPWGITVQSVEIRDVQIPLALQDAMSREAQAERERRARTILGLAETEIADKFSQAAATYRDNPVALHLRAMNMLYEAIKEKGSMVNRTLLGRGDHGFGRHARDGLVGRRQAGLTGDPGRDNPRPRREAIGGRQRYHRQHAYLHLHACFGGGVLPCFRRGRKVQDE